MSDKPSRVKTEVSRVESWLLDQGVPFVVRWADGRRTIARMTPGLLLIFITGLALLVARMSVGGDPEESVWSLLYTWLTADVTDTHFVRAGLILLVGVVVGIAAASWLSRRDDHSERLLGPYPGLTLLGGMALICIVHAIRYTSWPVLFGDAFTFAVLVILLFLFVRGGVSALFVWGLRRAIPRYGDLIRLLTRALPLQLVLVAFLFMSTEAWQVSDGIRGGRLALLVGFFASAGLLFLITQIPRELAAIDVDLGPAAVERACAGTPLERLAQSTDISALRAHELRRPERTNLLLTVTFAQAIQVLTLGVMMFVILVVFGSIALTKDLITSWIGHAYTPWRIFGWETPVAGELIFVAIMVASFSALQFAVQAVTDQTYRGEFFDSMVGQLERTLIAREVYLSALDQHQLDPDPAVLARTLFD